MSSDMSDVPEYGSVAVPPVDLLRVRLLEMRDDALRAVGQFHRYRSNGASTDTCLALLRPPMLVLYHAIRAAIARDKDKKFAPVPELLAAKDPDSVLAAWELMDDWLDTKRITRVDMIMDYDRTRAEHENKSRGL